MSYPNPRPKKLQRSRNDRWVGGVCGGLAEYLNMDPTLVRVLVIVIAAVTAAVPVAIIYLILMAVLPESRALPPSSIGPYQRPYGADQFGYGQSSGYEQNSQQPYTWSAQNGSSYQQSSHPDAGQPTDPVWGPEGAPWQGGTTSGSTPPPPRQSAEDLFSRAKHPTQPSSTGSSASPSTQD